MSSFGHYIRVATDDERAYWSRQRQESTSTSGGRFYACQTKGCDEAATHVTGYRYVTGRAGRVLSAEKHHCAEHAERFAKKHGLEMPSEPTERRFERGI